MSDTADTLPPKSGPSMMVQIGALLLMTAAAAGMGWFSGGYLNSGSATKPEHAAPASEHGGDAKAADAHGEAPANDLVIELPGIMTNLVAPSETWVRMELSIVLDAPQPADLPDIIHQDFLAYMRTLKLHQIEGPSGLTHLRADLEERASIRSGGHVKRVLIRTLLFE